MIITIEYCVVWHYTPRAVGLAAELLEAFEHAVKSITLIPSDGGAFEVNVDGNLIYSKLSAGRHAEAGEVKALLQKMIKEG